MVHKSSILPGLSKFLDTAVLSQYPPTSFKRIAAAGAIALILKQNNNIVDAILANPMLSALNISTADGMVDLDTLRDVYRDELNKASYMRISFPIIGDVDFTSSDLDTLYRQICAIENPTLMHTA